MLKIISIALIFLLCSLVGFLYGEKFKMRYYQLKAIYKTITILQNEVVFSNTPLPEAFREVAGKCRKPINIILLYASKDLYKGIDTNVYECFKRVYKGQQDEFFLLKEDLSIIEDFLKTLGESGVYGQEKIFNLCLENLRINMDEAFEECKKNTKLYKYLGMCVGAMISIILL